jgi:hypothetical protein
MVLLNVELYFIYCTLVHGLLCVVFAYNTCYLSSASPLYEFVVNLLLATTQFSWWITHIRIDKHNFHCCVIIDIKMKEVFYGCLCFCSTESICCRAQKRLNDEFQDSL